MTDEVHVPEEDQDPQAGQPEVEAEEPADVLASDRCDEEEEEEPVTSFTPLSVPAIELPAPEAEEVKAALRELRATAMRAASGEGAPDLSEAPDERAWFVVHCYSGYENKVKHNLEQRTEMMGIPNEI